MGLKIHGELRDPIHGLIPFSELEFRVINTHVFQRLRRIHQLALAELGFPGATHNRFSHCIGVMSVASRIVGNLTSSGSLTISTETEQDIRLAALLHDIGHGPFSHVSEYLLSHYARHRRAQGKVEEIHEKISQRIIETDKDLIKILGKKRLNRIVGMLRTDSDDHDFCHDIVSGPLDADKMDYLLRDSYFAGVKYGVFDLDRLINVLTLITENKRERLAAKREGVETVVQYVLAKYFLANQVYQHKIRHITDQMIICGIRCSIEEGNNRLKSLFNFQDSEAYLHQYLCWDDYRVCEEILGPNTKNGRGKRYFQMLRDRRLLFEVLKCQLTEVTPLGSIEAVEKVNKIREEMAPHLIDEVTKECNLQKGYTRILAYSMKVPLVQKSFGIIDENSIRIQRKPGSTTTLDLESPLYQKIVTEAGSYNIQILGLSRKDLNAKDKLKLADRALRVLRDFFKD